MADALPNARFEEGTPLPAARRSADTLALLAARRSTKWALIEAPGPTGAEIEGLIAIASRVPDHGKLAPWRFIVMEGAAPQRFGALLGDLLRAREPSTGDERAAIERARFAKVPVVVAVISRAREQHKIPVWEQELSAGASAMTLLIAAHALGFAGAWITEWFGYDGEVKARLGLMPGERIAGFVGLGSAKTVEERARPDPQALITRWPA